LTERFLARDAAKDEAAVEREEMRRIAAGDQAAFARLLDRESPKLLRFAQSLLGSAQEAEDAVQDTLLKLWQGAAAWRPEARVGTWLHRVCYNSAIDRLRRRRSFVDDSALDGMADEADLPEASLVRGEEVRSVRDALERLPHRQRTAVLLFHFQDLRQRDAADIMGLSEAAFESLLARARRQMRAWLAEGETHD
jgi:RNA polymerase sigma-70 factor (ECF subfamily)